jgi:hypothetical protein
MAAGSAGGQPPRRDPRPPISFMRAPCGGIAQLVRAGESQSQGRGFKSLSRYHPLPNCDKAPFRHSPLRVGGRPCSQSRQKFYFEGAILLVRTHNHPLDQATQNSKRLIAFAYFHKCDVEPCHLIPVEFNKLGKSVAGSGESQRGRAPVPSSCSLAGQALPATRGLARRQQLRR